MESMRKLSLEELMYGSGPDPLVDLENPLVARFENVRAEPASDSTEDITEVA